MKNKLIHVRKPDEMTKAQLRVLTEQILRKYQQLKFKTDNHTARERSNKSIFKNSGGGRWNKNARTTNEAFVDLVSKALECLSATERQVIFEYFKITHGVTSNFSRSAFYRILDRAIRSFCELVV